MINAQFSMLNERCSPQENLTFAAPAAKVPGVLEFQDMLQKGQVLPFVRRGRTGLGCDASGIFHWALGIRHYSLAMPNA